MDDDGQIEEAHSISAGLDYPGIGPEHAWLADLGRVKFLSATDEEALAAFQLCSRLEGIIPALEPCACAGQARRHRAEEAEGSPDGGQSLRPRRQGPRQRRAASRGQAVMRFYAWWNGMARQRRTGWTLVVVGVGYILYFLKARLFETGADDHPQGMVYLHRHAGADHARHHQHPHGRDARAPSGHLAADRSRTCVPANDHPHRPTLRRLASAKAAPRS